MARIFVSFHHELNQGHSNLIRKIISSLGHQDISVNNGTKIENEEAKTDEQIRVEIRDKFLRNVDVTIVIVGSDSTNRKHIDWEIRSTIHKFDKHKSGSIVVVNALKEPCDASWILDRELIKEHDGFYPSDRHWPENNKHTLEKFKWLPERLANSLVNNYDQQSSINGIYKHAVFPIINYDKLKNNHNILKFAIAQAIEHKKDNEGKWDTNSKMRRHNNESKDRIVYDQVNP